MNTDRFYIEGNNGGDYLLLEKTDENDIVFLDIGHCCVHTLRIKVPVAVLTLMFTEIFSEEDLQEFVRNNWPTPYGEELAKRIVREI
jgi:hypothetical protein